MSHISMASEDLSEIFINNDNTISNTSIAPFLYLTLIISLTIFLFISKHISSHKVFLLDFTCYKPPTTQKCTKETMIERSRLYGNFSETTLGFMHKMLERSGLGQSTYFPESLLREPPCMGLEDARREAEMVMFGAVDDLLAKTGVKCEEIGIVIVSCCIFNVTPSLCDMLVNKYKLGENVRSYALSGMGCSAGLIAIGLAKHLLQVHKNSYALVVSTESITQNWYKGDDPSKLIVNCLFRVGGAAMLLSNRPSDRIISKYQLIHTVHNNTASFGPSYECIFREEDHLGRAGVTITKNLMAAAIKTIEANLATLGRLILPVSEQILYFYHHVAKIKPYVPDFKKAIDHVIIHVGGKPVLDEVESSLRLNEVDMEASRMTLYRFGNTSSSTVWYELAYVEAKERIKKGDRVWQIAFGSGFKCSSVIWKALRTVDVEEKNPWSEEIDGFPVDLKNIGSFPYYFEPSKKADVIGI
ncbi:3-ketoacyl-CoA synthase 20-like [Tripterygium wilfordii]|uniref:3-ketoacyl-CoA synthase 20-like n=1 Tax=Tripterygium wilfordii TaxID=458696 RepID=UPI0018F8413D|nr:3-ketoacyl-CoA synthase 20-like [Tripterygium wilfordii]